MTHGTSPTPQPPTPDADPRLNDVRRLLDAADEAARTGDALTDRIATTGAEQLFDEIRNGRGR